MAKSKNKTKTPPSEEEKRKRTYIIPLARLDLIADRIVTMRPTKQIVLNDLKTIWLDGRTAGYFKNQTESKKFRDKRDATIKEMFDAIQDKVSDEIHGGLVPPKEKSNNQKSK